MRDRFKVILGIIVGAVLIGLVRVVPYYLNMPKFPELIGQSSSVVRARLGPPQSIWNDGVEHQRAIDDGKAPGPSTEWNGPIEVHRDNGYFIFVCYSNGKVGRVYGSMD